jgi:N-methylhydantoinase B
MTTRSLEEGPDPVLLEVMKGEFLTIVDDMCAVIGRTARSFGAREGGDYSAALIHPNGQVVARSGIAVWYVGNTVPFVLAKFGDSLRPGDIVIHNDPYSGGTHLLDVVTLMPVFAEGKVIAYVGNSIHHTDFGGYAAGGMSTKPTELFQEGLLLPRVLLYERGRPVTQVLEIIEANTRAPLDVLADLQSQVAGCMAADEAVKNLAKKFGVGVVSTYGTYLLTYTERAVRDAIRSIPRGHYRTERTIQGVDGAPEIKLVLTLHVHDDNMIIDFTGTDPQSPSALNVPPSTVAANVLREFHQIFDIDVPSNSGLLAPIQIVAPEGTVLNPRPPAAVGARSSICIALAPMFQAALAQAMPERIKADQLAAPILIYTPTTDTGQTDQMIFDLWQGGTGARPTLDGLDGPIGKRRISAEAMERDSPAVLEGYGMVPDTGGPGRFRGGLGVYRKWRFLAPGRVWMRNLYAGTQAQGLLGGKPGGKGIVLIESGGQVRDHSNQDVIEISVNPGDSIYQVTGGGGGHGDPLTRQPELVAADMHEGKISIQHARDAYGVIFNADHNVDEQRTDQYRRQRRAVQ